MKKCYVMNREPKVIKNFPGAISQIVFDEENSPITGFSAMVNEFQNTEFLPFGIHEDNEGFFVLEGTGSMIVADEEFAISAGFSMIVPAHTVHAIRKTGEAKLKIFLFHF
ncbi:cupin domain-containing protein [Sphaerochaeta pleomorpha str. Grapes]|uniref:Cupin domain-containing protein n=1 Tax=Sphaerochaeta pleomorpha (strain ATCC BAA-1885 / DSM 22778 / Grapes) TaxID=158190 RepID=G8QUK6_SPHPG|nr:cupin domain-containing protein [Sphaerochaeta pleomorpha]AEV29239.1 cupin domain-containing protein [Sphaerochaeta pleomorpha str. Grapes]